MAYLIVPSPGKSISDILGENIIRHFFGFTISTLFRTNGSQVAPQAKVAMQKASYIDPLVMMDSPNFELFVDIYRQTLSFCEIICSKQI